ncbi:MAG: type II toxin-antitoxin system VapC family toxin [Leptolyngbya sp. SIO1D8]|nr:type II toxin-antitoxin system VapC family toxin [Leptolyngbya sp. SIO1D8]
MSSEIAELSAQLRADYTFRTPDSIQLATAINGGAMAFLTKNKRFSIVSNLQILVLDELLYSQAFLI